MNIEYLKRKIGQSICNGEEVYIYDNNQKEKVHILGHDYITDINKIHYYTNAINEENLIIALWSDNDKNKLRLHIYLKNKIMYSKEN